MDERIPQNGIITLAVTAQSKRQLIDRGWSVEILTVDLGALIQEHEPPNNRSDIAVDPAFHAQFNSLTDIEAYLDQLLVDYPETISAQNIGTSVEGRPLRAFRIGNGSDDHPSIIITSLQHAREWAAVAATLGCMERLLQVSAEDEWLINEFTWYIVPVVNPDGYHYSWTTDRLWRKNRRDNGDGSVGVDLNRNWDYFWGGSGSSGSTGSIIYRGPTPFSEPELLAVRNLVLGLDHAVAHIDVHSYSQLVLRPFSCCTDAPPRANDHKVIGDAMAVAMTSEHGASFVSQPGYQLYFASGIATDWFATQADVLSWTLELRPRSGNPGFLLPASEIEEATDENWAAWTTVAEELRTSSSRSLSVSLTDKDGPISTTVEIIDENLMSVSQELHTLGPWSAARTVRMQFRREMISTR